jgi:hypothetical protein
MKIGGLLLGKRKGPSGRKRGDKKGQYSGEYGQSTLYMYENVNEIHYNIQKRMQ